MYNHPIDDHNLDFGPFLCLALIVIINLRISVHQTELGLIFLPHVVVAKLISHRIKLSQLKGSCCGLTPDGFAYPFGSVCTSIATIEIAIALHKLGVNSWLEAQSATNLG